MGSWKKCEEHLSIKVILFSLEKVNTCLTISLFCASIYRILETNDTYSQDSPANLGKGKNSGQNLA